MQFKQALAAAAVGALHDGTISPAGYAAVNSIAASPSVNRAKAVEHMVMHALAVPAVGAIDWKALIAQIQVLIPMIIQLIQLLKPPAPPPPVV